MLYRATIAGIRPIIMHSGQSIDPRIPANQEKAEITKKRGATGLSPTTHVSGELECQLSFWLNETGSPTIPPAAIRANLETAARKLKEGPQVREGLIVLDSSFTYDVGRYGEGLESLSKNCQFTTGVVVNGRRIARTRAKFELPWSCTFTLDCDDEQVGQAPSGEVA